MAHATMERHAKVAPAAILAPFARTWTAQLTTFRRDGTPVGTPVNIAVEGDHAFIRTWDSSGKAKRIRHNPEVEIAPSTRRGKPTGSTVRARARVLSGAESERAGRLITRKHPIVQGLLVPLSHRLLGYKTTHFELTPSDA